LEKGVVWMTQLVLETLMYNVENKTMYLERYANEDTKEVYSRIFKKSAPIEMKLQRDLYDFTEQELYDFVKGVLQPKTKESSRSIYSTISSYIDWSIYTRKRSSFINPWKKKNQQYIHDLVLQVKNYISFEEKEIIIQQLINAQDQFIIEALWNGIQGDKLSELVTLTLNDVNIERNEFTVKNKKTEQTRIIQAFDDKLVNYALAALQQTKYIKKNGECNENTISESSELNNSIYIIKPSNTKNNGEKEHTTHYTIYNRIEMIRELQGMKQYGNALVTKNIVRSGMIYYGLLVYLREGVFQRKQIEEVCGRFNVRFKWSMKDFLNLDTMQQLYPHYFNS